VAGLTTAVPDWVLDLLPFSLAPDVKVALADGSRSPRQQVIVLQP
jgi:hypothetical protein